MKKVSTLPAKSWTKPTMSSEFCKYAVKRATWPYFKKFVIVEVATNKVIGHYGKESDAQTALQRILAGLESTAPSAIQPVKDPIAAQELRMRHPMGEPKEPDPVSAPGIQKQRSIHL